MFPLAHPGLSGPPPQETGQKSAHDPYSGDSGLHHPALMMMYPTESSGPFEQQQPRLPSPPETAVWALPSPPPPLGGEGARLALGGGGATCSSSTGNSADPTAKPPATSLTSTTTIAADAGSASLGGLSDSPVLGFGNGSSWYNDMGAMMGSGASNGAAPWLIGTAVVTPASSLSLPLPISHHPPTVSNGHRPAHSPPIPLHHPNHQHQHPPPRSRSTSSTTGSPWLPAAGVPFMVSNTGNGDTTTLGLLPDYQMNTQYLSLPPPPAFLPLAGGGVGSGTLADLSPTVLHVGMGAMMTPPDDDDAAAAGVKPRRKYRPRGSGAAAGAASTRGRKGKHQSHRRSNDPDDPLPGAAAQTDESDVYHDDGDHDHDDRDRPWHRRQQSNGASMAKTHTCSTCGVSFARQHDMRRHARTHAAERGELDASFACTICGRAFTRADALRRHGKSRACRAPGSGGAAGPGSAGKGRDQDDDGGWD